MRLKGCRKCGGDLVPDRSDREGLTMYCLQCGLEAHLRPVGNVYSLATLRAAQAPPTAGAQAA
jgi:hypothetical protein